MVVQRGVGYFHVSTSAFLVPSLLIEGPMVTDFHTGMETVAPTGITVYGDPSAYNRLFTVAENYPNIWNDIGGVVNIPESE